jgi:hypothetical protein
MATLKRGTDSFKAATMNSTKPDFMAVARCIDVAQRFDGRARSAA